MCTPPSALSQRKFQRSIEKGKLRDYHVDEQGQRVKKHHPHIPRLYWEQANHYLLLVLRAGCKRGDPKEITWKLSESLLSIQKRSFKCWRQDIKVERFGAGIKIRIYRNFTRPTKNWQRGSKEEQNLPWVRKLAARLKRKSILNISVAGI